MEPKKNPKHDVHRHRNALLSIGLLCSLAIVIMAFEWRAEIPRKDIKPSSSVEEMTYDVPITYHIREEQKAEVKKTLVANPTDYIETPDDPVIEIDVPVLDAEPVDVIEVSTVSTDIEPEVTCEIPLRAEVMPQPKGGYQEFYERIGQLLRYPKLAQRQGVEGKVRVDFVVNEKGEPVDMQVVRGIGGGCDEEAMRVLKLIKWNPGKQRGVPVKVRMSQTITFSLKNR